MFFLGALDDLGAKMSTNARGAAILLELQSQPR